MEVNCVPCNNENRWKIHGREKHIFPGWKKIEGLETRKNITLEDKRFRGSINKSLTRRDPLSFPFFILNQQIVLDLEGKQKHPHSGAWLVLQTNEAAILTFHEDVY